MELLHRLRERIPGLAIRTTFITGFPGETEEDHEALLEFVDEFQFDMLGVFRYSHEAGTPAGTMDDDPEPARAGRGQGRARGGDHAHAAGARVREREVRRRAARSQFDVLIDDVGRRDPRAGRAVGGRRRLYVGRCYHQAPQVDSLTYVRARSRVAAGELVRCTIVDADGYDLIAEPTEERQRVMGLPVVGS